MQRLLQTKGKLLGIDYGDKRTGLAVCDRSRLIASGIGQISVGGMQKTAERICEIAKEEGITTTMETCGFFSEEYLPELKKYCDVFLWDIKDTDDERHKKSRAYQTKRF